MRNHKEALVELINNMDLEYKLKKGSHGYYSVEPMPSKQELDLFYKNKYSKNPEKLASSSMDVGDDDLKERFFHDRQYKEIIRYMDQFGVKVNSNILDVGAGRGCFLRYLLESGYQHLYAVEPDCENTADKGIHFTSGDFLDVSYDVGFDFISFNNVLEHVIEPVKCLNKAYSLLNPNGVIRIQVPNDLSYTQYQSLKDKEEPKPYFYCPPEHLHYFDFGSLRSLVESCGFKVVEETTYWCMDFFLLMGMDYSKEPEMGPKCHRYRLNLEYNLGEDYLYDFYRKMAQMKTGRVVIFYIQKQV
jgi:2-polyprenyl-3-methyl-5-hydroxy-6-metoxy-1,4-benzoquinol methylase